ncbi:DUF3159 domain-containing protein [Marinactinospora thermotolerans]|uniref:Intracellular septation protein A n=1 Tax=Marinactinospora thermotolerans DSM 45154 TaxID=1122192 RepID=A0A1T4S6G1_9ACTN|nr:DUF3159 domain-containing protein [Marinactinospora thermotolerans]SKA23666.1 Protein of unknown function [Marinactinospora thermotolerans DSM 45154]
MTDQHRTAQTSDATGRTAPSREGRDDAGQDEGTDGQAPAPVGQHTVEAVVRAQLAKALGGVRGMLEAAVPTVAFTVTYLVAKDLYLALGLGIGAAVVLALVRIVQRSSVQFVFNSLLGITIAAVFALRSGQAEDAFLPGIIYNAGYAVVLTLTILFRWPAIGLMIGAVTGDPVGWRDNPAILRLSSRLTWLLVLPCVVRVVVQYPLWASGMVAWLGAAKVVMGWPIQVAALAAMVWLLARGNTPMEEPKEREDEGGGAAT